MSYQKIIATPLMYSFSTVAREDGLPGSRRHVIKSEIKGLLNVFFKTLQTPNDCFLHHYLLERILFSNDEIDDLKDYYKKHNSIELAALFYIRHRMCANNEDLKELWASSFSVEQILDYLSTHPHVNARDWSQQDKRYSEYQYMRLFMANRDKHQLLGDVNFKIPLGILSSALIRQFYSISDISKPLFPTSEDILHATSIREVSIEETLFKIVNAPLMEDIAVNIRQETYGIFYGKISLLLELISNNGNVCFKGKYNLTASGKGSTSLESAASAYMEFYERYAAISGLNGHTVGESYSSISKLEYGSASQLSALGKQVLDLNSLNLQFPYMDQPLHWVSSTLRTKDQKSRILVPHKIVFLLSNLDEHEIHYSDSNGLAAGNTIDEALLQGGLEIIERDGDQTIFYSPERVFKIKPDNSKLGLIIDRAKREGIDILFLDLTTEFGIPTYRAFIEFEDGVESGCGAHFNAEIAIMRAVGELLGGMTEMFSLGACDQNRNVPLLDRKSLPNYSTNSILGDLNLLISLMNKNGYQFIYTDLTLKENEIPVVKVLIPGLDRSPSITDRKVKHLIETKSTEVAFRNF